MWLSYNKLSISSCPQYSPLFSPLFPSLPALLASFFLLLPILFPTFLSLLLLHTPCTRDIWLSLLAIRLSLYCHPWHLRHRLSSLFESLFPPSLFRHQAGERWKKWHFLHLLWVLFLFIPPIFFLFLTSFPLYPCFLLFIFFVVTFEILLSIGKIYRSSYVAHDMNWVLCKGLQKLFRHRTLTNAPLCCTKNKHVVKNYTTYEYILHNIWIYITQHITKYCTIFQQHMTYIIQHMITD